MVTIRVFGLVLLPCVDEPEIQCEISNRSACGNYWKEIRKLWAG